MSEPIIAGVLTQEVLGVIEQPGLVVGVLYQGLTINQYEGGGPLEVTIEDVDGLPEALAGLQPLASVLTNTTAAFTTAQETKLAGVQAGAQVNVAPDWGSLLNIPAPIVNTTVAFTIALNTKLAGIETGAQVNVTPSWGVLTGIPAAISGTTASFTTEKDDKLSDIEEGAQVNVPPSWGSVTGIPAAVSGTTASFTTAKDAKLSGVEAGAQANVAPDWLALTNIPTPIANTTVAFTTALNTKLAAIEPGAQVNVTPSWGALTGIPAAVSGTTASFTTAKDAKLSGIEIGAQVNVAPDWAALTSIPAAISGTTASFTTAKDAKLTGIETGAQVNVTPSWGALTGIPAAVSGTTASFTTAKDTKLTGIETGAQVNVTPTIASVTGLTAALADKQTGLWTKAVFMWRPTIATAGLWTGTVGTGAGTYLTVLPSSAGSVYAGMRRSLYSNIVTTTNQVLGQRNIELIFFIGNVANKGGFFFQASFGFDTWTNGSRLFVGFSSTTNNVVTVEPSANPQSVGFAVDSTDNGAIYFMSRNGTTTTRQATGLTITSSVGFDARISCDPNGTAVAWYIKNLETGVEVTGSINTTLPTATVTMTAAVLASNAALTTLNATQIGVARIYVESNY